jgi:flagellar protein FliS
MKGSHARGYAKQYNKMAVQTAVDTGSPHRLVQMLFDGAVGKITVAKGHLSRGEIAQKGQNISWAISIIEGLRSSLDMEKGGEIAANLDRLYDYMKRRLVEANISNDPAMLDEVASLLRDIKGAWDAIAPESGA